MNQRLKAAYDHPARRMPELGDVDRAIATARRRRAWRAVGAPIAVAALAAAVTVVAVAAPWSDSDTRRATGPEDPTVSVDVFRGMTSAENYPSQLQKPGDVASLPDDPVGSAIFIYSPCFDVCRPYLVLHDGRQFGLERSEFGPALYGLTLSPGGRWLGQAQDGGYLVRDLTTRAAHRLTGEWEPWAWSSDGNKLLLANHDDGFVHEYLVLDVSDGSRQSYLPWDPSQWTAVSVLSAGTLVFAPYLPSGSEGALRLVQVDPATGERRDLNINPAPLLRAGETTIPDGGFPLVQFDPDASHILLATFIRPSPGDVTRPSSVVVIGSGGDPTARYDIPPSISTGAVHDVWDVLGTSADELILSRFHANENETKLYRMAVDSGTLRPSTEFKGQAQIEIAGSARY